MWAMARVPGTCGELLQGQGTKGIFLVTCPIDRYAQIAVELTTNPGTITGPYGEKTRIAIRHTLEYLGASKELGASFTVYQGLPKGKGMASSTADIVAATVATATALGVSITPAEVAHIALAIEPSDGLMFPGIVAFDHRQGKYLEFLGNAPPLNILYFDLGGRVNTLQFNRDQALIKNLRFNKSNTDEAFALIKKGFRIKDWKALGQGATLSSLAHQRILPKAGLENFITAVQKVGVYGVNVAHSGTLVGVLLPKELDNFKPIVKKAKQFFGDKITYGLAELIDGGYEIWQGEGRHGQWVKGNMFTEEISGA